MTRSAVAALALATLAFVVPGVSRADPNNLGAVGSTCDFVSTDDPTGSLAYPGTQVGHTEAGPLYVAGLPGVDDTTTPPTVDVSPLADNPASAEIICDIQVGGTGHFSEADASHVVSSRGTVVAYLPPTLISYQATPGDTVWSCTTWRLYDAAGAFVNLYADSVTGEFSTDPTTATCDLAISQQIPPQEACDVLPQVCDVAALRREPIDVWLVTPLGVTHVHVDISHHEGNGA